MFCRTTSRNFVVAAFVSILFPQGWLCAQTDPIVTISVPDLERRAAMEELPPPVNSPRSPSVTSIGTGTSQSQDPNAPQLDLTLPEIDTGPSLDDSSAEDISLATPANVGQPELITERYANGKIKIQRQVQQDADRNYRNHGSWVMYDQQGKLAAQGGYVNGQRHGNWLRMVGRQAGIPNEFTAPLLSQANFENGRLSGTWTLTDNNQKIVASWDFQTGQLHGKVSSWFPNGQQRSEMTFVDGNLDGEALFFDAQGKTVKKNYYRKGEQVVPVINRYDNKQKESEGWMVREISLAANVDWWTTKIDIRLQPAGGKDIRTGKWTQWHANGTIRSQGSYIAGKPNGNHLWWHENGQKQLAGKYAEGIAESRWTRWHSNGQKAEEGTYLAGTKQGQWDIWNEQGQLVNNSNVPRDSSLQFSSHGDVEPAAEELPAPSELLFVPEIN